MKKIILPKEEKAAAVTRIRQYFADELDQTIGVLPAEFLLEFFANDIGAFFYNQGLRDAHAALTKQMEDFGEAIYLLERERTDET
ncbi:DUF2164 domain-containing protein [Rhizobium tumorigenes]|uniref:DUF2164 domain-containing protein n=1 Tax=Rhizobium tumorigenes TaxID=2041385 RepID=A0AAF1K2G1_9HYPH|nr:DUF2164 domain-containing protein [Rhizobium tumorigenes]WFR94010.1 DUF2164 domain-containing protein [Rhizobium tumorigenes]